MAKNIQYSVREQYGMLNILLQKKAIEQWFNLQLIYANYAYICDDVLSLSKVFVYCNLSTKKKSQ
jgi:hypothetical protein